jgi:hypothetical protein
VFKNYACSKLLPVSSPTHSGNYESNSLSCCFAFCGSLFTAPFDCPEGIFSKPSEIRGNLGKSLIAGCQRIEQKKNFEKPSLKIKTHRVQFNKILRKAVCYLKVVRTARIDSEIDGVSFSSSSGLIIIVATARQPKVLSS